MRTLLVLIGIVALVVLAAMMLGFVRFDQTQTAQLPRLEGGQAPKFQADVAKVSVGTQNKTVEVPAISVDKPAK
ncbi:MAG: hypothetical protein PGN23_14120 [Sphingomonas adhaesiva]|uniref:hypothetical protein n=1 Tax=Sphingomonas adhaesiva TaxID=28212 RepID=UPI002FF67A06